VLSERLTVCAVVYDPGATENAGVAAAGRLMVNVPVATELLKYPEAMAIAWIVVVADTAMGVEAEKSVDPAVGVVPLVV